MHKLGAGSALRWDDPKVFMACARDPKSLIYQELQRMARTSTAAELCELMDDLAERDVLAGNPITGAHHRAIELIQEYLRLDHA